jgi:hypothetical protein
MLDTSGIPVWHVLGMAARIAIALNLHRRVDQTSLPVHEIEQRKRVFYALFNLDRMYAATLSKPLAIADDDIDIEVSFHILSGTSADNSCQISCPKKVLSGASLVLFLPATLLPFDDFSAISLLRFVRYLDTKIPFRNLKEPPSSLISTQDSTTG